MSSFLNLGWVEKDVIEHLKRAGRAKASEISTLIAWPAHSIWTALESLQRAKKIRSVESEREIFFELS